MIKSMTSPVAGEEIDPAAQAAMDILIRHCLIYLRKKIAADKDPTTEASDG